MLPRTAHRSRCIVSTPRIVVKFVFLSCLLPPYTLPIMLLERLLRVFSSLRFATFSQLFLLLLLLLPLIFISSFLARFMHYQAPRTNPMPTRARTT